MKKAIVTVLALMLVFSMVAFAVPSKTTQDTMAVTGTAVALIAADDGNPEVAAAVRQSTEMASALYAASQTAADAAALTKAISDILGEVKSTDGTTGTITDLSAFDEGDNVTVDSVVSASLKAGTSVISDQTKQYTKDSKIAVVFKLPNSDECIELQAYVDDDGNIVVTVPPELDGKVGTMVVLSAE